MNTETIEIRLGDMKIPNPLSDDPLILIPGRRDYFYELLSHRLAFEQWPERFSFDGRKVTQLDPVNPSVLQTANQAWLFEKPDRVLYYALELLGDDATREYLFGVYTEEAFPDQKEAKKQLNLLQKRFTELKALLPS